MKCPYTNSIYHTNVRCDPGGRPSLLVLRFTVCLAVGMVVKLVNNNVYSQEKRKL